MSRAPTIIALCAAAAASACMYGPIDEERVASRETVIHFKGLSPVAGQIVSLQARDASGTFVTFGEAVASREPTELPTGTYFAWEMARTIPAQFWRPGARSGHRARIRTDRGLATLKPDWAACMEEHDDVFSFQKHCTSADSPEADIVTRDFCDVKDAGSPSLVRAQPFGRSHVLFPGWELEFTLRDVHPLARVDRVDVVGVADGKHYGSTTLIDPAGARRPDSTVDYFGVAVFANYDLHPCENQIDGAWTFPPMRMIIHGTIGGYCDYTITTELDTKTNFYVCGR